MTTYRSILPRRVAFLVAGLCCLTVLALAPAQAAAGELRRLAVVGVSNQTDEAEFGKLLIAEGIAHLVAQELYDTGVYVPVEDSPEITARIREMMTLAAQSDDAIELSDEPLKGAAGCDAVAAVTIRKFRKSRLRGFLGPFSSANVDVTIEVEVSLRDGDAPMRSARGSGKGTTKSRGILFQVREDQVHFDQTSVGQATQDAVRQAVAHLVTPS